MTQDIDNLSTEILIINMTKRSTGNLNHDDSAFLYFSAIFLSLILLPVLYRFTKFKLLKIAPTDPHLDSEMCGCSICQDKRSIHKAANQPKFGKSGLFQLLFIIIIGYLLLYTLDSIRLETESQEIFMPYEILGISEYSTEKEVKSAFRELSKIYHPDKNPNFENKYIQITKAYKALTNEEAKRNYERYGNPDGPGKRIVKFM